MPEIDSSGLNNIPYLHDRSAGMELILCLNSVISYPRHNHISVITIGMVLCGSIFLTVGNRSYICGQDVPFIILPYIPHTITAKESYSLFTVCIHKDTANQCSKEEIQNKLRHLLLHAANLQITEFQMLQLISCLDSFGSSFNPCFTDPALAIARKQIESFPEMKLSIDELSRACFSSKYHFIRSFKREVGLTPHQFQIQNRIRRAQLLLSENENITEVALATGFCDQSHFIKHFEKQVGLTPTAYKASCRLLTAGLPG